MIPDEETSIDELHIGDYIILKEARIECFMSAEGILSDDIYVDERTSTISDSLFAIHLQRQYSAFRELEHFLKLHEKNPEELQEPSTMKYLAALKRGRDNEQQLNESYLRQRIGSPVNFGDVIQLFHVKSGKYLTILPNGLAKDERENMRVHLHPYGNPYSWIKLAPRFKINREGDPIVSNTELYLKVNEKVGEFVHCASKNPKPGYFREVNCSMEDSSWKVAVFQSSINSVDTTLLFGSQLVIVQDPETFSNLTIFLKDNEIDENTDMTEAIARAHDLDSVALEPSQFKVDSNSLWIIEKSDILKGGPINWKTDHVRLRHLNSGVYLCVKEAEDINLEEDFVIKKLISTTDDPMTQGTLMSISELHPVNSFLGNSKPCQIGHIDAEGEMLWVCRGELMEEREGFPLTCSSEKVDALNVIITRYQQENFTDISEPFDVHVGVSLRIILKKFAEMTEMPTDPSVNTVWPSAEANALESFLSIMNKTVAFTQGYSINFDESDLNDVKPNLDIKLRRQNMLREQGMLQILLTIINKLVAVSELTDITVPEKSRAPKSEETLAVIEMGQVILDSCFSLLYEAIIKNPRNQMYVVDYIPVLLAHLGEQVCAAKCVTEMLNTNMELQETKITKREISTFVEKLRKSEMNPKYVSLIKACCSCLGNGVDNNQCRLTEMIFQDMDDIIIQIHPDGDNRIAYDWNASESIYISRSSPERPILGDILLSRGLPVLTLTWTSKTEEASPKGLFSKPDLSLEEVFAPVPTKMNRKSQQMSILPLKLETLAEFLIQQMYLCAELCMDRNYVGISTIDQLFPYETLVAILNLNVSLNLKAATANLIVFLYIDKNPQFEFVIPALTRTWADISKSINSAPALPCVEPNMSNKFAFLQQICADHIRNMAETMWSSYSYEVVKLLYALVRFNFYGSSQYLIDIIRPLLSALDRRRITAYEQKKKSKYSSSKKIENESNANSAPSKTGKDGSVKLSEIEMTEKGSSSKGGLTSLESGYEEELSQLEYSDKFTVRWEERLLLFIDSYPYLVLLLLMIIPSFTLSVYVLVMSTNSAISTASDYYGLSVSCAFSTELLLRVYCCYSMQCMTAFFGSYMNVIDVMSTIADLAINIIGILSGELKSAQNIIKILRFLRVLRCIFKGIRLASQISDIVQEDNIVTVSRYSKSSQTEISTMIEILRVLSFVQKIFQDRNLSVFLQMFYKIHEGERVDPGEIFEKIEREYGDLTMNIEGLNDIFVDCLMYEEPRLVQTVLDVIVSQYSFRSLLLQNSKNVQLLASSKREMQFYKIRRMILDMQSLSETQELWGELSSENDRQQNDKLHEILKQLIDATRRRRFVLEFNEDYEPEVNVQNLLRNVGFFETSDEVYNLLESIEEDNEGDIGESGRNVLEIVRLCNTLMFWFLLDNSENQELGFKKLDFFLKTLDEDIGSHLVIRAIFRNNEDLMKKVVTEKIQEVVDMIAKNGQKPQYLSLLASISHVGDKNITENQYEIVKALTAPSKVNKTMRFLCSGTSTEYQEKLTIMQEYSPEREWSIDELHPDLSYHIYLMEVLSGCTIGRLNITTIEAKVQSLFSYVDIVHALYDPRTILVAKISMGLYFLNAVIDVEMKVSGLERTRMFWALLETYPAVFSSAKDELRVVEKYGWSNPNVSRQRMEYMLVCAMITGGFFSLYYAPGFYVVENDRVTVSLTQIENLIQTLFAKIKDVYDIDSPRLSKEQKEMLYKTLDALNNSAQKIIVVNLDKTFETADVLLEEALQEEADVTMERELVKKYESFLKGILDSEDAKKAVSDECMGFISTIQKLPMRHHGVSAPIYFESFVKKLVFHLRSQLIIFPTEKRLDHRCTQSTIWLLRGMRRMIEDVWGMDIYARDDDGGEEQDEASADIVNAYNAHGVTELCIDMICPGVDKDVKNEGVKLLVAMLFKEGGSLAVQDKINQYLSSSPSHLFFIELRDQIKNLMQWHLWHDVIILEEDEDPSPPDEIIIIRFIQLLAEGHFLKNQDIMREQLHNKVSYNLLDDLVDYLKTLSRIPCKTSTNCAIRVAATILELIQGPSEGNQTHFALSTEIVETINRIMRAKVVNDCDEGDELELKTTGIDIIQGLLEGQGRKAAIYERILAVIHMDVILTLALPQEDEDGNVIEVELDEDTEKLHAECLVLLRMFCDFRPELIRELGIGNKMEEAGANVASIEVVWRGELQRRFFLIPSICSDLAPSSKADLVEEVDRSNLENKLLDFLRRCRSLYREIKYQQKMKEWGISAIFSAKNQDRATWIAFGLSCVINLLLLICYNRDDNGEIYIDPPSAATAIFALNIFQCVAATFTLVLFLVVKVPVNYETLISEENMAPMTAGIYSLFGGLTLYYVIYLAICLFGLFFDNYWTPFLLLDIIVKNPVCRNVLNAIMIPRKSLGMTIVLGAFVGYIYAYIYYFYFAQDSIFNNAQMEDYSPIPVNLFMFTIGSWCWGLRYAGGFGDTFITTLGPRLPIDLTFFLVITIVLLNIIFGVIVDTFGELRKRKVEKTDDIENRCFICGIEKEIFDRALEGANGFQEHIKKRTGDHHMWHYFYFIVFVMEQDKDDDDGLEWYIRRCLEKRIISWFPMTAAMSLRIGNEASEENKKGLRAHVQKLLSDSESKISGLLMRFVEEAVNHLDHFQKAISNDARSVTSESQIPHWEGEEDEDHVDEYERSLEVEEDDVSDISSVGL